MKNHNYVKNLTTGALTAAIYVALTFLCSMLGLSSGVIQLRFSEALCILPMFYPAAIPGLFIGCIIANAISGCLFWDVVFGSLATLIGALGAYALRNLPEKLAPLVTLPTIVANTIIVPYVLVYAYGAGEALPFIMLTVFIGEFISAGIGGSLLYPCFKRILK